MDILKNVFYSIKKNYKWVIAVIFFVIFCAIAEDVFEKEIFGFDSVIYNFFVQNRSDIKNIFFKGITNFGSSTALIAVAVCGIIFAPNKKDKALIPLNLGIIALLNFALKNIFERSRPISMRLIEETGYSFPSGHAMVSVAFYGYIIYLLYKNIENKKFRNISCIALVALIILIGVSRVYVGVHYASDVIGGACFSIFYLIVFIHVTNSMNIFKNKYNMKNERK